LVQLAIDQEAASDKEVVYMAPDREIDDLVQLAEPHFVRIDQYGQFFLAQLPGPGELRI
jgi:hypothetical protein